MRTVLLLLLLAAPAWGGWRHDCRQQMKACHLSKGVTTTTTLPCYHLTGGDCPSCNPKGCCYFLWDGLLYCPTAYSKTR